MQFYMAKIKHMITCCSLQLWDQDPRFV